MTTNETLRLSPSAINTYFRSPRLFFYQYILKLKSPANIHLYKGSFIHKVLEDYFSATRYIPAQTFFNEQLTKWNPPIEIVRHMDENDKIENHLAEIKKMLEVFAHHFEDKMDMILLEGKARDKNHAWNLIKPKLREHKIFDEERNIVGIIDSIEMNFDNEVYVIDYKTSKLFKNTLSTEYVRQIAIYAYLYKKEFGKLPDYIGINYLRYSQTYMIPLWIFDGQIGKLVEDQAKKDIDYVREHSFSRNISDYQKGNDDFANRDIEYFEKKYPEHTP
jgi:ATP-dependent helicase/DNAse subunit B